MLNLHFSNRTEALAERLLGQLSAQRDGPFALDHVIVPSAAMRRWLTLAIARHQGICANLRFDFLAQWLWRQVAAQVPRAQAATPFAPALLAWRVHAAFGDADWVARHPRLAHYLHGGDPLMRLELAQRVAALLEQYGSYRPDWLQAWLEGRRVAADTVAGIDEDWQAELWQRLAADLDLIDRHPVASFVDALQRGGPAQAATTGLPARVHVFALPAMPPLHQQLLAQLGRVIEVEVYVLNPCREHWFELVDRRRLLHLAARGRQADHEEGNRLLAAWGRQTQALVDGLVDLGGDAVADDADYRPHPGGTLLAQLQNAMLDLQPIEPASLTLADDDRSLELHVCHSRTRELEVLHDRLLGLFAADPTLQPCDVLVVTPDLEATAPLVDAVFGSVPVERRMPYAITGRARSSVNAPARALLDLLALLASRVPVSAVFGLLQQPVVARRFGLGDDDDLQQVHDWLRSAGVHWGLDGAHRGGFGVPPTERHTLADGLSRLYLGYALPAQVGEPLAGRLPGADIGGQRAGLLGRLWAFADAVQRWQATLCAPRPAPDWIAPLLAVCDGLIDAQGDERADLRELRDTLAQLGDEMQQAGLHDTLPLAVVRQALQQRLDDPARGGVPTGSVTVSAMASLRGLPYRVVCIIGLDDGAYPSAGRAPEFDLMAAQPRRGDRQRRLDERNLFLDLLLAARTHLHLSHCGRSVRDNTPLPPSVLVADLLDLLLPAIAADPDDRQALHAARQRLVVEHPLQPFSPRAFAVDGDPRLRSHDHELAAALRQALAASRPQQPLAADLPAAGAVEADTADEVDDADDSDDNDETADADRRGFFTTPLPAPGAEWRTVAVEQLVEFFRNPSRYLLRRRLGLELRRDADELRDDEPLVADRDGPWALAERLLPVLLAGAEPARALRLAEAGTDWPAGALGRLQLQQQLQLLTGFAARVRAATATPALDPCRVDQGFELDGQAWTLRITLAGLRPEGQLRWRCAELSPRDRLDAWIHHLALCAAAPAGVARRTTWLALHETVDFTPVDDAQARLAALLALYRQGLAAPLPFFANSAWALVDSGDNLARATAAWTPSPRRPWAEGADAAHRLAWRGRHDMLDARFVDVAHRVFDPLREHLAAAATPRQAA